MRRIHLPHLPGGSRWRIPHHSLSVAVALLLGSVALAAAASLAVPEATRDASRLLSRQAPLDPGGDGLRGRALLNELERLRAITPFPPLVHDDFPVSRLEGVATGSVQAVVEVRAQCWWQRAWVIAMQTGDTEGAAAANAVLHNAIDWPSNKTGVGAGRVDATDVAHQAQTGQLAAFQARMATACQGVFRAP